MRPTPTIKPQVTVPTKPLVRAKVVAAPEVKAASPVVQSSHVSCDCGKTLRVPPSAFGKKVRCPCGKLIDVAADGTRKSPRAPEVAPEAPSTSSWLDELPSASSNAYAPSAAAQSTSGYSGPDPWKASPPASNPYAAPAGATNSSYASPYQSHLASADAESIRRAHIQHEASIRRIGTLQQIGALFSVVYVIVGIYFLIAAPKMGVEPGDPNEPPAYFTRIFGLGMAVFSGLISALLWWVGDGLKRFKNTQRTVATVLLAIGLISIPIGTLINGYFLWLLHSQKGNTIFSPEYRRIIKATPHVKPGMSCLLKALLALLAVCILFALVILVFALYAAYTYR
ncbi:MAG: hypothetical protein Aurels2KO_24320 [Aureliella sp.]